MWSYLGLTVFVQLIFAVHCIRRKVENITVEIEASKFAGSVKCPTPVVFDVRDDSKILFLAGTTKMRYDDGDGLQCIRKLQSLINKDTIEIHYGRQISREVIVQYCNLTGFTIHKGDKKRNLLELSFHCDEEDRSIHLCTLEYLFAVIFAGAVVTTFFTITMHFCCRGDKQTQTTAARSGRTSQRPNQDGADSVTANNSSTRRDE